MRIALAFFILQGFLASAWGAETVTALISSEDSKTNITGLTWRYTAPPVKIAGDPENPRLVIKLEGNYVRENWSLASPFRKIQLAPNGDFSMWLEIRSEVSSLELIAIGPQGVTERERITITFQQLKTYKAKYKESHTKAYSISAGLGPTLITYQQSRIPSFSEIEVTGKVSYYYTFAKSRWNFGAIVFANLATLHTSLEGSSIRFIGINGRFAYNTPWFSDPWRFSISAGIYYLLAHASGSTPFGFDNLAGPQIFPTLLRYLKSGDRIWVYGKFSPVSSNFSLLGVTNHEIGLGLGWGHALESGHAISVSFDFSNLHYEQDAQNSLTSNTFSLGVSYSL